MAEHTETPDASSFWLIVMLSVPTYAALAIVVMGIVHPNTSVYLLIPLMFISPATLISAVIVTVRARQALQRRLLGAACAVLLLALLAGVGAIAIVRMS